MLYNLSSPLDEQNARARLDLLVRRKALVELAEKKPRRSLGQNSYLHLLLGYFASQTGNTLEWVKEQYYKKWCNPDIFCRERFDELTESQTQYLRSSAELATEEMSLSIERFRNWAATMAGIYLPEPHNEAEIAAMQTGVERYRTYLY